MPNPKEDMKLKEGQSFKYDNKDWILADGEVIHIVPKEDLIQDPEPIHIEENQVFLYHGIEHIIIQDELLPVISNDINNNTKLIEYYFKSK